MTHPDWTTATAAKQTTRRLTVSMMSLSSRRPRRLWERGSDIQPRVGQRLLAYPVTVTDPEANNMWGTPVGVPPHVVGWGGPHRWRRPAPCGRPVRGYYISWIIVTRQAPARLSRVRIHCVVWAGATGAPEASVGVLVVCLARSIRAAV